MAIRRRRHRDQSREENTDIIDNKIYALSNVVMYVTESGTTVRMATRDAINAAQSVGMTLLCVAPNANPPVCKPVDYGKYVFERQKKERQGRKASRDANKKPKSMKFRLRIGDGDYDMKMDKVREFLEDGSTVNITVMMIGREQSHPELGVDLAERISADLEELTQRPGAPRVEGRDIHMTLTPDAKKIAQIRRSRESRQKDEGAPAGE